MKGLLRLAHDDELQYDYDKDIESTSVKCRQSRQVQQ